MNSRIGVWSAALLGVATLGCGPGAIDVEFGDSLADPSDTNSDGDDGDASAGNTGFPGEDDGDPDPGPFPGDDGSWGTDDGSPDTGDDPDTGDGDGLPAGSNCYEDWECASDRCYLIPFFGGLCGECTLDNDCTAGGCTSANPFTSTGSVCNQGLLGDGCNSDLACQPGLTCALTFSLFGAIEIFGCSECQVDEDCGPGVLCTPISEFAQFAGAKLCLVPGALQQDDYCDLEDLGDLQCATGVCSGADVMGLAQVGACGECNLGIPGNDCPDGLTCVEGTLDFDTGVLTGSRCQ